MIDGFEICLAANVNFLNFHSVERRNEGVFEFDTVEIEVAIEKIRQVDFVLTVTRKEVLNRKAAACAQWQAIFME